jgi:DNA-binding transcriptional regulator PaaX
MFDIAQLKKLYREVLRGKLKELGFQLFQKSVWITPYDCKDEIELLKDFFGLTDKEIKLITAQDIGDDKEWKKSFGL